MKKILALGLMTAGLMASHASHAKDWYVGAGLGWAKINESGSIGLYDPAEETHKGDFSDNGFQGAIFLGKNFDRPKFQWFFEVGGSVDNLEMKKTFTSSGPVGTNGNQATQTLKRVGTLNIDFGVKKSFTHFDGALRLGVLLSKFEDRIDSRMTATPYDAKRTQYAWGIAPGVGISKKISNLSVGLNCSYQVYDSIKTSSFARDDVVTYNFRTEPRYWNFMATVSKSL